MFKKLFECDNAECKAQSMGIYQLKVELTKLLVGNGEKAQFAGQPRGFSVEVCGRDCAVKEIDTKLKDAFRESVNE